MDLTAAFPALGVVVRTGDLELRGLDDESLCRLAQVAADGIHAPDFMPFSVPWTDVPTAELPGRFLQYHWRCRADFAPESWTLNLGTWWRGELVGTQGITTKDYLQTRTGETGSWLGRRFQGQGIGTTMRRAMCALLLDQLDATSVTSAAYVDNAPSLRVSEKVGYQPTTRFVVPRRSGDATQQEVLVTTETFNRAGLEFEYEGVAALRTQLRLADRNG